MFGLKRSSVSFTGARLSDEDFSKSDGIDGRKKPYTNCFFNDKLEVNYISYLAMKEPTYTLRSIWANPPSDRLSDIVPRSLTHL